MCQLGSGTHLDATCLPESAFVRTEGSAVAHSVGSLTVGQRVLCYDRLARSIGHDEIALVQPKSEETFSNCVTIQLRDGTQQNVHPAQLVWPLVANYEKYQFHGATQPVSVSHLLPGVHSLVIMKIAAAEVRSVTPVARVDRASVVVRLANHARYQIMVTQQQVRAASTMVPIGARQRLIGNRLVQNAMNGMYGSKCSTEGTRSPGSGDCVPAGLLAWTEGSLYAQPMGTLKKGDRLLCYDRLTTNMCHVPLIEEPLVLAQEENRWVSIMLADGTQQDLTMDCPLTPRTPNHKTGAMEDSRKPITAGRLVPGSHSLVVIKTMADPVTSISRASGLHREFAVALKNPNRYDLLLCQQGLSGTMLAFSTQSARSVMHQISCRMTESASSSSLSTSSDESGSGESVIINLGGVTTRKDDNLRKMSTSWSSHISLQNLHVLSRANLGCLGSLAHAQGGCCVCMFHERYQRGRFGQPCKYGFLCDRCHEIHATPENLDVGLPEKSEHVRQDEINLLRSTA